MAVVEHCWIILALAFIACSLAPLLLHRRQWGSLFAYIQSAERGRRASTSKTPPRSLSPYEKDAELPSVQSPVDYRDIFPPSSRDSFNSLAVSLHQDQRTRIQNRPVIEAEFRKGIIPFEADYRSCRPSTYTPTEISIDEVKALGDFPDYAELSGIPLPDEYKGFKLDQAIPRPYRPFRWAYHQTMCMCPILLCKEET